MGGGGGGGGGAGGGEGGMAAGAMVVATGEGARVVVKVAEMVVVAKAGVAMVGVRLVGTGGDS